MTPRNQLLLGDAATTLRRLAPGSIDQVLTSPPYFRARTYDAPGQLGLEPTIEEWADQLAGVADELRRMLVPTGTLWLNLGDGYAAHRSQGAPRKSHLMGPERVALRLIAAGWHLRNKIIWRKTNPLPNSVRDRLTCTWEYVYVFSLGPRYYFDLDGLRVPHTTRPSATRRPSTAAAEPWRGPNAGSRLGLTALSAAGRVGHPLGRNPGDVWEFAASHYRGPHPATFPLPLAKRVLQAGCPVARCRACHAPYQRTAPTDAGDAAQRPPLTATCGCRGDAEPGIALDPFMGAGTTAVAAQALGRDWLGIELSRAYVAEATARINQARAGPAAA
jgi:site-specific DNA-methyltransferase (adenine-specific)